MAIKKKKLDVPVVWMTVYSDLVTNEALFFMMLFASVLIAYQKGMSQQEFKDYMRGVSSAIYHKEAVTRAMTETGKKLSAIEGVSGVKTGEKDLRIILPEPVLFEPGRAKLKDSARRVLANVGAVLAPTRYELAVEGYTDDAPVTRTPPPGMKRWQRALARSTGLGPYYSNRELSAARALQVLQFFSREGLIPPERLSASAYGDSMPLVPNTSAESRARNRRVEIKLVLKSGKQP